MPIDVSSTVASTASCTGTGQWCHVSYAVGTSTPQHPRLRPAERGALSGARDDHGSQQRNGRQVGEQRGGGSRHAEAGELTDTDTTDPPPEQRCHEHIVALGARL